MARVFGWDFEERSGILFLHFDVQENFLKLDTFVKTAESVQEIVASIDDAVFGGQLDYEIIVLPPENGSFLSKLAVWIGSGGAAAFAAINTPVGAAYIEGLTEQPPAYWAEKLGEQTRELIEAAIEHELIEPGVSDSAGEWEADESAARGACNASAEMVVALTRGVLEKPNTELESLTVSLGTPSDALQARSDFYSACLNDPNVRAIGFSPEDYFPIPRNSFPERAQKPTRRLDEESTPPWIVSVENIYVTSPNWDKDDQSSRQWKGKDLSRRDCYFIIDDEEFWRLVHGKDLRVDVLDNLKVQWAYQVLDGRPKNRRVLKVLEFNGKTLAQPLDPDEVRAILGDYTDRHSAINQPSLF